jgi:hypothetical protein
MLDAIQLTSTQRQIKANKLRILRDDVVSAFDRLESFGYAQRSGIDCSDEMLERIVDDIDADIDELES